MRNYARRICWPFCALLSVSACSQSPGFILHQAPVDCDETVCEVTIDVENTTDLELPLIYEISLNQNFVQDPDKSGLVIVGEASGEIKLPPRDRQIIEFIIEVTEKPNGSKVAIFDSRTPDFVRSILEP